jgi:hypothetical protein
MEVGILGGAIVPRWCVPGGWGARIQVCLYATSRYLALARPSGFGGQARWRENMFYLPNLVPILSSFMEERPDGATPESWRLFP